MVETGNVPDRPPFASGMNSEWLDWPVTEANILPMLPTLTGERVTLAPFRLEDSLQVQEYAGDEAVARTTMHIPHPYPNGVAEEWIASHDRLFIQKNDIVFAIRSSRGELYGAINLLLNLAKLEGELGYWVAVPFWGRGYCTEAVRLLIAYGFETLPLRSIHAHHFAHNPASGRVMAKAGMKRAGYLKEHVMKHGELIDVVAYEIAREEFEASAVA